MKNRIWKVIILVIASLLPFTGATKTIANPSADLPYKANLPFVMTPWKIYIPPVRVFRPSQFEGTSGGTITSIIFVPNEPYISYVASWNGGVYRSIDKNQNWKQVNSGLPSMQINTLAIDPNNPKVLYAAPYNYGIYKTTDGGASWTSMSKGMSGKVVVYSIVIDPKNSSNVYASMRDNNLTSLNPPWKGTIYRSTDGGANWTASLTNAGGSAEQDWIYSLTIDPKSTNTIYAAAHEMGAYRSTDSGKSWSSISNGLNDQTGRAIVIDPTHTNPSTLYFGVWHRSGVFKTNDSGAHWNSSASGITGTKIYGMSIDPNDASILYAATYNFGLYKSTNAGGSWFNIGFNGIPFLSITASPLDSKYVLAGAGGTGLWESIDGGASWTQIKMAFSTNGIFTSSEDLPFDLQPGMED
jgi:photosystem II stability/assembly factor-like uncharacterized protein